MKRNYSRKDFIEFWKKKNRADERRDLKEISLPFSKKLEIMGELMEEYIFLSGLTKAGRIHKTKRRVEIRRPVHSHRRRKMRETIKKAA